MSFDASPGGHSNATTACSSAHVLCVDRVGSVTFDILGACGSPWHFSNRTGPQLRGGWDQRLGAVSMPTVVAKLQEIGKYIASHSGQ